MCDKDADPLSTRTKAREMMMMMMIYIIYKAIFKDRIHRFIDLWSALLVLGDLRPDALPDVNETT